MKKEHKAKLKRVEKNYEAELKVAAKQSADDLKRMTATNNNFKEELRKSKEEVAHLQAAKSKASNKIVCLEKEHKAKLEVAAKQSVDDLKRMTATNNNLKEELRKSKEEVALLQVAKSKAVKEVMGN